MSNIGNRANHYNRYAHALISEDDEFGSLGFPAQTEDQIHAKSSSSPLQGSSPHTPSHNQSSHHSSFSPFPSSLIPLEPPVTGEDYNFTLCDNEGIAELFDDDFLSM